MASKAPVLISREAAPVRATQSIGLFVTGGHTYLIVPPLSKPFDRPLIKEFEYTSTKPLSVIRKADPKKQVDELLWVKKPVGPLDCLFKPSPE